MEPLMSQKLDTKLLSYRPCAILVGKTGAGKTTLYNNLCGTRNKSGAARGSVTQELHRKAVCVGDNAFDLIDTPGSDSSSETYKHALLLREALTASKLNTIFLIIKYENRFDKMVDTYIQEPVNTYGKKVVVMVSYLDESKNPQDDFKEICEAFSEECRDFSNIIFFSEKSSPSVVANLMFACISNMKREQIEISDEEFHLRFNIYQMKGAMNKTFIEYKKKGDHILKEYCVLAKEIISEATEDQDDRLHMTIVQFKNEVQVLLDLFRENHGVKMVELEDYTLFIKMQKENVKLCDTFGEFVVPLMSYSLFDNQDPRNLIKRCPHCDLIWFKVEGCDGATTCGNRVSNFFDTSARAVYKYVIERINGKLECIKNSMVKKPPSGEEPQRSTNLGCGRSFVWKDVPKIEEELILQLYKVKTIDEAKALIKSDQFKEVRAKYEKSIDKTFKE